MEVTGIDSPDHGSEDQGDTTSSDDATGNLTTPTTLFTSTSSKQSRGPGPGRSKTKAQAAAVDYRMKKVKTMASMVTLKEQ